MSELRCKYERYAINSDNAVEVTFSINNRAKANDFVAGLNALANQKKNDLTIKIRRYKERRSLSANAYMWILCDKLANKLRTTKERVYRRFIQDCGVFTVLRIENPAVKEFAEIWASRGIGWFSCASDDNGYHTEVHAFYGSSVYDKEQMQRLLNEIVDECKGFGIETKTPDEIAEMVSLHEKAY